MSFFETSQLFSNSIQSKFITTVCILFALCSVTFGGHHGFGHFWENVYGWFEHRSLILSDDLQFALVDKLTLNEFDALKNWSDPRISNFKIENGSAKIFFNSPEKFSAYIPISYDSRYKIFYGSEKLSFHEKDWSDLIVDFPAGSGIVTISMPRINSIWRDYAPRGIYCDAVEEWKYYWDNGFDSRITKFERNGKNFLIEYDLSKAETNILGNSKIELPIINYPVYVSEVNFETSERHLIQIDTKNLKQQGNIEISYSEPMIFKIGYLISLISLLMLIWQSKKIS